MTAYPGANLRLPQAMGGVRPLERTETQDLMGGSHIKPFSLSSLLLFIPWDGGEWGGWRESVGGERLLEEAKELERKGSGLAVECNQKLCIAWAV